MNKIIIKRAKSDDDFVGVCGKENVLTLSFPIGYHIMEEIIVEDQLDRIIEIKKDCYNLFRSLEINSQDNYSDGNISFAFSSAIFIVEDYLENGLILENNCTSKLNGEGRINWKKTINRTQSIYVNRSFFYNDFYSNKKNYINNQITMIQKYCLSIACKITSWMYGLKLNFNEKNTLTKEEIINILNKELYSENNDRKRKLFKEMIHFVNGTNISELENAKEFRIGRNHYDKIWENILHQEIVRNYTEYMCNPTTYYYDTKFNVVIKNSELLPDIVIKEKEKIIIFDAKYYREGTLPQSSDICKQLFYGNYIMNKARKYDVINVFLLPKELNNKEYEYFGYANAEHLNPKNNIYVYYLDTKKVLESNITIKNLINELKNN